MTAAIFHLRHRSLLRGNLLVLVSLGLALLLSGFPNNDHNLFLVLPAILASLGTVDSIRCMRTRWSWYHGGVVLLIYMDLMAVCMILFLLLYPYLRWIGAS